MIGLYLPGTSGLHRMSAGAKLLGMVLAITGVLLLRHPWQLGVAAVGLAGVVGAARLPAAPLLRQLWPLRWLLVVVAGFQWVFSGPRLAIMVCGNLILTATIAALVTVTTRVTAMLDLNTRLLRPLRRFGVDPDRVGLVLALTIRCIPVMSAVVGEVQEARKARGLGYSLRALAAPVVIRALRRADAMGEALTARGVDD